MARNETNTSENMLKAWVIERLQGILYSLEKGEIDFAKSQINHVIRDFSEDKISKVSLQEFLNQRPNTLEELMEFADRHTE